MTARARKKPAAPSVETGRAAGPIVKWPGGKTKLLPELLARMPPRFGRYYEPFAGGAALFFRVAPERAVVGDLNADLVNLYRCVATDVDAVIAELQQHSARHSEDHYYATAAALNVGRRQPGLSLEPLPAPLAPTARAAAFLYLNKAGFNGLWRVNGANEFNVSWGKHPAFRPDVEGLRTAAAALASVELRAGDYRNTLADVRPGDFVYCDPPYDETWTGYTAGGAGAAFQIRLAADVRALAERGVHVMLSNEDTPRVRELYAGLRIDVVRCPRSINRDGEGRGAVDEVIVMAGYEPAARSAGSA